MAPGFATPTAISYWLTAVWYKRRSRSCSISAIARLTCGEEATGRYGEHMHARGRKKGAVASTCMLGRAASQSRRRVRAHLPRRASELRGHQRSSEVIRGHQRAAEVIRGHQRSSVVISGHQRSSEAIRRVRAHLGGSRRASELLDLSQHRDASYTLRLERRACLALASLSLLDESLVARELQRDAALSLRLHRLDCPSDEGSNRMHSEDASVKALV